MTFLWVLLPIILQQKSIRYCREVWESIKITWLLQIAIALSLLTVIAHALKLIADILDKYEKTIELKKSQ